MNSAPPRLAVLTSHPIQYYAPLFRELVGRLDLHVFFAHKATPAQQADAGFGIPFDWDVDLLSGYPHTFLKNVAQRPGTDHFSGCDTPEIASRLAQGRFSALLITGWNLKSFVQGLLAAKRLRVRVMVRGDSQLVSPRSVLKRTAKELFYPAFLRAFDAALYVGSRNRAYFQHYRYPGERLFYSPHCVDTAWFAVRATADAGASLRARHGIAADAPVALFAGKLVPFKRPLDLIAAAAIVRGKGIPLQVMLAGAGELYGDMVRAAGQAGVPLTMLGFCNQSEMPAVYAACDFLVLPSDARETWGLVANEALACGRAVALSDACGAAPDLAGDGVAGVTFPAADIGALARAMEALLRHAPSPESVSARSGAHSLAAAADGVCMAVLPAPTWQA
jgi:glycosyltransferase involved in cell wall biosynthesis